MQQIAKKLLKNVKSSKYLNLSIFIMHSLMKTITKGKT